MKKQLFVLILFISLSDAGFCQSRYDVVIDEIMADPTPQIGLPNNEWIELKNISSSPVDLAGWRVGDPTKLSGPMPPFVLQPDSFVIVCTGSAVAALSVYGNTISVTNFPSLDNTGDEIKLVSNSGAAIHAVIYSDTWYQNVIKADGGWTLEMIDTKMPCTGNNNWKASTDNSGGTPGRKNAADGINTDTEGPSIKNTYPLNDSTLIIEFTESVDSLSGATTGNYNIDGGISLMAAKTLAPLFYKVQLSISPLSKNTVYNITVNNISDCSGNSITTNTKTKAGISSDVVLNDVIINEILFNPKSGGSDYAEFYNRSSKIIDAGKLYIANRNSSGTISSQKLLSSSSFLLFPGDYIVVTEDINSLPLDYFVKNQKAVVAITAMPSLPDDEGTVVLLNFQGDIIDEVHYKDDWHFKLIDNPEGVSLERIDPDAVSQNADNWHSAASTAGYGTPGYQNSQHKLTQSINATITVIPKVFSPDNDGHDDITSIQYKVTEPGYIASITIFDASGRPVRYLIKNGTLGLSGYWNWDGLGDKGQQLPIGPYIIFTEIFNLQGKKERFKNTVVLARSLK